eukprot:2660501-Prymnesium_polylepis.1
MPALNLRASPHRTGAPRCRVLRGGGICGERRATRRWHGRMPEARGDGGASPGAQPSGRTAALT